MNMKQWREDIIARPDRVAIPIMTHPGIEELGYTVRQAITDGEIHAKAVNFLADNYPGHAASVIMDLTVEAEAFGAEIVFPEDEIAAVTGHMLNTVDDIHRLRVPSLSAGRVPQYLKANVIAHKGLNNLPLLAGCIGPFSLAGRLYDMSEIMILIYSDPEAAHELLEKCTLFIYRYCAALKAAGVEGVVMAEPAAGLMSNDDCKTFSSNYVKRIIDELQDDNFLVVLHNCGNTGHCTEAMVATGAHAFHLGNKCDFVQVTKDINDLANGQYAALYKDKNGKLVLPLVMGNLDPVSVFKMSTPEEMYDKTKALLEATKDFPNVVISSGCDTPPHTPLANVDAFYRAMK